MKNHAFIVDNFKHVILLATVIFSMHHGTFGSDHKSCKEETKYRRKKWKNRGEKNFKEEQKMGRLYLR